MRHFASPFQAWVEDRSCHIRRVDRMEANARRDDQGVPSANYNCHSRRYLADRKATAGSTAPIQGHASKFKRLERGDQSVRRLRGRTRFPQENLE
jgi:hypothetical protein